MSVMKDLVTAISQSAPAAPFRLRQGTIVSVAANGSATVTIAGSATQIAGVKVASHVCPIPGSTVFLATDGRDMFVHSAIAPAGPAFATMRKSTAQTIGTGAFEALAWGSRTDTVSNGITLGSTGMTIVVPGIYSINCAANFVGNNTGNRHAQIVKNGSVITQGTTVGTMTGTQVARLHADAILKLAIGDVINASVYQNSGAGLATDVGAGSNVLTALWIGPSA